MVAKMAGRKADWLDELLVAVLVVKKAADWADGSGGMSVAKMATNICMLDALWVELTVV